MDDVLAAVLTRKDACGSRKERMSDGLCISIASQSNGNTELVSLPIETLEIERATFWASTKWPEDKAILPLFFCQELNAFCSCWEVYPIEASGKQATTLKWSFEAVAEAASTIKLVLLLLLPLGLSIGRRRKKVVVVTMIASLVVKVAAVKEKPRLFITHHFLILFLLNPRHLVLQTSCRVAIKYLDTWHSILRTILIPNKTTMWSNNHIFSPRPCFEWGNNCFKHPSLDRHFNKNSAKHEWHKTRIGKREVILTSWYPLIQWQWRWSLIASNDDGQDEKNKEHTNLDLTWRKYSKMSWGNERRRVDAVTSIFEEWDLKKWSKERVLSG